VATLCMSWRPTLEAASASVPPPPPRPPPTPRPPDPSPLPPASSTWGTPSRARFDPPAPIPARRATSRPDCLTNVSGVPPCRDPDLPLVPGRPALLPGPPAPPPSASRSRFVPTRRRIARGGASRRRLVPRIVWRSALGRSSLPHRRIDARRVASLREGRMAGMVWGALGLGSPRLPRGEVPPMCREVPTRGAPSDRIRPCPREFDATASRPVRGMRPYRIGLGICLRRSEMDRRSPAPGHLRGGGEGGLPFPERDVPRRPIPIPPASDPSARGRCAFELSVAPRIVRRATAEGKSCGSQGASAIRTLTSPADGFVLCAGSGDVGISRAGRVAVRRGVGRQRTSARPPQRNSFFLLGTNSES
jgi:hypothetical protein